MFVFASAPNTDPGNRQILHAIEHLAHHPQVHFYKTLPRDLFVSLFKQAKLIIGNSSAGIMEAASIPIPAVNVGRRQRGRLAGSNVLFSDSDRTSIEAAVATALSEGFQREIAPIRNIYGDGHSAATAYELITTIPFRDFLKKPEDPLEVVVL